MNQFDHCKKEYNELCYKFGFEHLVLDDNNIPVDAKGSTNPYMAFYTDDGTWSIQDMVEEVRYQEWYQFDRYLNGEEPLDTIYDVDIEDKNDRRRVIRELRAGKRELEKFVAKWRQAGLDSCGGKPDRHSHGLP